ncbi:MAG: hypothetical protein CALGDGBN_00813 [Pseudomonadales bacterium]|nr:hypothetical protein [Pseudomonadales bacterium]
MSYILDALRRSEQERRREAGTPLQSIHAFQAPPRPHGMRRALTALPGIALACGGLAVGTWFGPRLLERSSEPPALVAEVGGTRATGQPEVAAEAAPGVAADVDTQPAAVEATDVSASSALPASPAVVPGTPANSAGELLEPWQLSEGEQRFLHGLTVSMHVYSAAPEQRTAIINGFRVREGQSLGQDLELLEIVPDGIIVGFQRKRVHLATVAPP